MKLVKYLCIVAISMNLVSLVRHDFSEIIMAGTAITVVMAAVAVAVVHK